MSARSMAVGLAVRTPSSLPDQDAVFVSGGLDRAAERGAAGPRADHEVEYTLGDLAGLSVGEFGQAAHVVGKLIDV